MASDRLNASTARGSVPPVEKEDIAAAVLAWLPAFGLPEAPAAGIKDLAGREIPLAKFTDEETCRFFFPRRALVFQQRMQRELGLMLRRRGAKMLSVRITSEDYARWCEREGKTDSEALRFDFATRPPAR